jgi:aspartate carbamoyltransferase regulatory subunit
MVMENFYWLGVLFGIVLILVRWASLKIKRKSLKKWQIEAQISLDRITKEKGESKEWTLIKLHRLCENCLQNKFGLRKNSTNTSFGTILKLKAQSFEKKELDQLWIANKTRNILVHNHQNNVSDNEITEASKILIDQIKKTIEL